MLALSLLVSPQSAYHHCRMLWIISAQTHFLPQGLKGGYLYFIFFAIYISKNIFYFKPIIASIPEIFPGLANPVPIVTLPIPSDITLFIAVWNCLVPCLSPVYKVSSTRGPHLPVFTATVVSGSSVILIPMSVLIKHLVAQGNQVTQAEEGVVEEAKVIY